MILSELIADLPGLNVSGDAATDIRGLTADSRAVRPGWLFAAIPGLKQDGRAFIQDAASRGAVAVLTLEGTEVPCAVRVTAQNPRGAFARMAAAFYGAQPDVVAAVTGTNGKSSTVNFCRQIWRDMGRGAACLGTIGVTAHLPDGSMLDKPGALTTPDPAALFSEIAGLTAGGVTHLALEASSQGLDQYRLDGLKVTAAGFTNLTRDHLDYHGGMEKYFAAKMRLFREGLVDGGVAVVNDDCEHGSAVRAVCAERNLRVIGFGEKGTEIRLEKRKPLPAGQFLALNVFGGRREFELPLIGDFQASNALCALGLVLAERPEDAAWRDAALRALERHSPVRGRLELAAVLDNGAAVYVDYAHTPDGLETMLKAIRPHVHGRLHAVFGCGGDRDRGKRPIMGEITVRLADRAIVTDDNPRTENAAAIRAEIMKGATGATEIGGRRDAIRAAIGNLAPGDILVIAGKGHEQGQIVGSDVLPFDDVTEAKAAVRELMK